jgi:hypothetical protein
MQIRNCWAFFPQIIGLLNVIIDKENPEKNEFDHHMEIIDKIDTLIKNSHIIETREPLKKELNTTKLSIKSEKFPIPSNDEISDEFKNSSEIESNFRYITSLEELSPLTKKTDAPQIEFIPLQNRQDFPWTIKSKIKKISPFHQQSILEKPTNLESINKIEIVDISHFTNHNNKNKSTLIQDNSPSTNKNINKKIEGQANQENLISRQEGKKRFRFGYKKRNKTLPVSKNQLNENQEKNKIDQLYYVSSINSDKHTKSDDVDGLQKELDRVQKEIQEKQEKLKDAERKAREQKILLEQQRRLELKKQKEAERIAKKEEQEQLKEKKKQEREKLLKQKEAERIAKKEEQERLKEKKKQEREKLLKQKQKEQEQLLKQKQKEQEELKKQKEAERIAKKEEQEQLLKQKQKEQEELKKQKEAERIAKKEEQEQLIKQALEEREQKKQIKTRVKMRRHPSQKESIPASELPPQQPTLIPSESIKSETKESTDQPIPTIIAKIEQAKKSKPTDSEVIEVLNMLDKLLADLPEEAIQSFAKSKDFALYEKIMSKYKHK